MKKKKLELFLQRVPSFINPNPLLEQYLTPANIVADILFIAYHYGDVANKKIIDLGCGTGIFSVGLALLGSNEIVGIDVDKESLNLAKKFALENDLEIRFMAGDINTIKEKFDTVIMNPPFGAQKDNLKADRSFIEKGFEIGTVIYSLHLSETIPFIEKLVSSLNGKINFSKDYIFPLKHLFEFHKKEVKKINVTLIRIT